MRILLVSTLAALLPLAASAAAPVLAHLEVVSQFTLEEINPDADHESTRITSRTQGQETWRAQLRIEGVDPARWAEIKKSFPTVNLDSTPVIWADNTRQRPANAAGASGGTAQPVWPVRYEMKEATWTLVDQNRHYGDRPSNWVLTKTAERNSGGSAEWRAGVFVEMMRSIPQTPEDIVDSEPLIPGADSEPEMAALTPFFYNLTASVSGFLVKTDINGTGRSLDIETGQWSESKLEPPKNGSTIPAFEPRVRPGTIHNGHLALTTLRKRGLSSKLVEQLVSKPQSVAAPIQRTATLTEIERASDDPTAPVVRKRETRTTLSLRIESLDLPPAESPSAAADALTKNKKGR